METNRNEHKKHKKYTIKEIANEFYISESTMKNYIYAETKIPIEMLCNMTKIFEFEKIEDLLVFEHVVEIQRIREEKQTC